MIILLSYYPVSRDIFPVANSVFSCVASDMMITWKAHPVPGDFREKLEMEAYHSDPGFMQAMQAYLTGDRADTLKVLEKMLEKYPNVPSLLLLIGNTEYSIGRLTDAAGHYEKAIELSPGFCQAY